MPLERVKVLKMAIAIMSGTFVLLVIANAVPIWGTGLVTTVGLWQECLDYGYGSTCRSLEYVCGGSWAGNSSACGKMMTARAFMTIACMLSILSTLVFMVSFKKPEMLPPTALPIVKWLPALIFVFALIGVATGISFATSNGLLSLGVGAIFGIISLIASLCGAGVAAMLPTSYDGV